VRSPERPTADRGLALLGGVAVLVVSTVAAFTQAWPWWAYPAAGLVAAVRGARSAAALDIGDHQPFRVTVRQLAAVVPTVWFAALVTLPLIMAGWPDLPVEPSGWSRRVLLGWLVPVIDPRPGDPGHHEPSGWLWLIRALVWLTVLAPVLVFCFRRWTRRTVTVVLTLMAATAAGSFSGKSGLATEIGLSVAVVGGPWLLGVARYDGTLQRWRPDLVLVVGAALIVGSAWRAVLSPNRWNADPTDPSGLAAAAALTLGVTLLAVRFTPALIRLSTHGHTARVVDVLDARLLTVYLWSGICGSMTAVALHRSQAVVLSWPDATWAPMRVAATAAGVVAAVLLLGWVEDLGAGPRPRPVPHPAPADP
jgi:hypothetical protein